jgi:hypothetical protein
MKTVLFLINLSVLISCGTALGQQEVTKSDSSRKQFVTYFPPVDKYIPQTTERQDSTYAIVIGNEHYNGNVVDASFACNDARVFSKYLERTLGVQHIDTITDASYTKMLNEIPNYLDALKTVSPPARKLIFYYAGHGQSDNADNSLMPCDANNNKQLAIKLDTLYALFKQLKHVKVICFLDACRTGVVKKSGDRGIAGFISPDDPPYNTVVFWASNKGQPAGFYKAERHGLFTYFLLQKLQQSNGDCTYGQLFDYLKAKVPMEGAMLKDKQYPTDKAGTGVEVFWKNWKL